MPVGATMYVFFMIYLEKKQNFIPQSWMEKEKHKSYDVSFKLKAVNTARKKSISAASRELGVDRKRIP